MLIQHSITDSIYSYEQLVFYVSTPSSIFVYTAVQMPFYVHNGNNFHDILQIKSTILWILNYKQNLMCLSSLINVSLVFNSKSWVLMLTDLPLQVWGGTGACYDHTEECYAQIRIKYDWWMQLLWITCLQFFSEINMQFSLIRVSAVY